MHTQTLSHTSAFAHRSLDAQRLLLTAALTHGCFFAKYFPVPLHTIKLAQLLPTTKLAQSTAQYYFVLHSSRKVLLSTTSYYAACTRNFPACKKYFPVLLRATKHTGTLLTRKHHIILAEHIAWPRKEKNLDMIAEKRFEGHEKHKQIAHYAGKTARM